MILDPGEPGDSDDENLSRLLALRLPELRGKRFLDLKCRTGFFCQFAHFEGASASLGVEADADALAQARAARGGCELVRGEMDEVPSGPFDVVLLTSALHRAADPAALVRKIVGQLSTDGMLVLELGIARHKSATRLFPTRRAVQDLLAGTAWKQMGASARPSSDHVRWHVYHVRPKKPFAYLLLEPPAHGKSLIARELFTKAGVPVVSGDETLHAIARGRLEAPPDLARTIEQDFSTSTIDRTIHRVVERGQAPDLLAFLLSLGQGQDFALDAFLPSALHSQVEVVARAAGYLPVFLKWSRPHEESLNLRDWPGRVEGFGRAISARRTE